MGERVLRGRHGHARVAVLTVIPEEFDAIRDAVRAYEEVGITGMFVPCALPKQKDGTVTYPFVIAQCPNRSNTPASQQTRRLLEYFRPEIIILVGIAGGIQRLSNVDGTPMWVGPGPGDVVVADYVHYADFTKNISSGHFLRYFPIDHPSTYLVGAHAHTVVRSRPNDVPWFDRLPRDRPDDGTPQHYVGEIVALEGVAGDPKSARQQEVLKLFDNALAVDMESMGVGRAIHESRDQTHYNPLWMCVRGISDVVRSDEDAQIYTTANRSSATTTTQDDNDETRQKWKHYAAAVAARYTVLLLERLLRENRPEVPADPGAPAYIPTGGWIAE
jgi:nucleoside phosphorylase